MNGQASAGSSSMRLISSFLSPFVRLSFSLLVSHAFGPSSLDARCTNENSMNAITSRHCRLFRERYYLPVFAHVIVAVVGHFLSLPHSSPYLLCLHVGFYLDWRLFRCSPNNDSVHLAVTHAGIFARISLVRVFSLRRNRRRFQEGRPRERKREIREIILSRHRQPTFP